MSRRLQASPASDAFYGTKTPPQVPDTPQSNLSSTPSMSNAGGGSGGGASSGSSKPAPLSLEQSRQVAQTHYKALKSWLIKENGLGNQSQRGNAREKLTRLTRQQFQELSTDVYDELVRRMDDDQGRPGDQPFLPVRSEFHPKRNQARQKLATLPLTRFRDLASDVYYELDRRYPEFSEEEDQMPSPPQQQSGFLSQSSPSYSSPSLNNRDNNGILPGPTSIRPQNQGLPSGPSHSASNSISRRIPAPNSTAGGSSSGGNNTNDVVVPNKSTLVMEMEDEPSQGIGGGGSGGGGGGDGGQRGYGGHQKNNSSLSGIGMGSARDRDPRDISGGNSYSNSNEMSGTGNNVNSNYGGRNGGGNGNDGYDQEQLNSPAGRSGSGYGNGNGGPGARASETSSLGTRFIGNYAGSESGTRKSEQWEYEEKDKIKSEYEYKLTMLQNRLDGLQKENDELKEGNKNRSNDSGRIRDLESQVRTHRERYEDQSNVLTSVRQDLESLQQLHASRSLTSSSNPNPVELSRLKAELSEMESLSNELRMEVSNLVDELRSVNARYEEVMDERERDKAEKAEMEEEMKSWKKKFEQAKTDLRNTRATSQIFSGGIKLEKDHMPASSDGLIADVHVTSFQTSIDDLLQAARSKEPSSVLPAVRAVVAAVEKIDSDVQAADSRQITSLPVAEQDRLQSLKAKTNATLSNLMTACKNHATSFGVSPVSLLDAAASHLSATVVDLVRILKIRKTSGGSLSNGPAPANMQMSSPPPPLPPLKSNGFSSSNNNGNYNNDDTLRGQNNNSRTPYTDPASPGGRYKSPPMRGTSLGYSTNRSYGQKQSDEGYRGAVGSPAGYSQGSYRSPQEDRFNSPNQGSSINDRMSGYDQDSYGAPRDNYNSQSGGARGSVLTYGSPNPDEAKEPEQTLESYLETQTEAIVNSIQSLLSAIRGGAQSEQLNENLTQIITIVSSIVAMSKDNIPTNAQAEGVKILNDLTDNCDKLSEMQSQMSSGEVLPKQTKQSMASASFGVAKSLKALNSLWQR